MFFNDYSEVPILASKTNFSIFVFDDLSNLETIYNLFPKNSLILKPDEKTKKINVENVRDFTSHTTSYETEPKYFIVENADQMNESAENAFLKNLEEPKENYYYVLFVKNLSSLLPTIRSRAEIYIKKNKNPLEKPVVASEKVKTLAKNLIIAKPAELIKIATEISGKKDNARNYALEVVATSIEIVYKSYFATKNEKFLKKLPNLLELYSNLEKNGHIKLHFVADML